jgi:hypothetical protein
MGCENGGVRYPGIVVGVCAVIATYQFVATRPIDWSPGVLVASEPRQVEFAEAGNPEPIALKGVRVIPRARFSAEVRVLSRSRYWLGKLVDVSPLDIAVGWGAMSDSAVLKQLDISQSGRFYFWHYDDEPPVAREVIETHSANWHLVPSRGSVWRDLRDLRVGDVVELDGLLVDLEGPDVGTMKTSLRRDDTGAGACEIVFVERVSLRYH